MFKDLIRHLKMKEVRLGIILFLVIFVGVINFFISSVAINTFIMMLFAWGLAEVIFRNKSKEM